MPTALPNLTDETRDELAQMALQLGNNPKTRKKLLGLVKEMAPDTPIPEIDEVNAVNAEIAKRDEAIAKLQGEFNDYRLGNDMAARKKNVSERYGLSAEEMQKIEERMGKKELPTDYEWAARLHKQESEVAAPTNYGSSGFGPFEMPAVEGLMENEQNWSLKTAHSLIDDIQRKNRGPAF
jgi:hypothetical protein